MIVNEMTRDRIETVLKAVLGPSYVDSEIVARADHYGDPALFIRARFDPPEALPGSAAIIDATVALRDELVAQDDQRFPYLDPIYPEEPVSDEAA